MKTCTVEECNKAVDSRGWCSTHYARWRRHGSPTYSKWNKPAQERFWEKVDKTADCWVWTGAVNPKGYGRFWNPNSDRAHCFSWELEHGPIPADKILDHRCRNRRCVKPAHMRLSTPALNAENQGGHHDSRSGHRGVRWHTSTGKWQAVATKNGKAHYAGTFTDVNEAAEAAKQLRLLLMTDNELDKESPNASNAA